MALEEVGQKEQMIEPLQAMEIEVAMCSQEVSEGEFKLLSINLYSTYVRNDQCEVL